MKYFKSLFLIIFMHCNNIFCVYQAIQNTVYYCIKHHTVHIRMSVKDTEQDDSPHLVREDSEDCAICLQPCLQPVKLSCGHIFCFLCAKVSLTQ